MGDGGGPGVAEGAGDQVAESGVSAGLVPGADLLSVFAEGDAPDIMPVTRRYSSGLLTLPAYQAAAPHRCSEAILAPSAWDRNFAQVTVGTTASIPAIVPNPQSVPAITLSRPTTSA
jgi:hypothetical protein